MNILFIYTSAGITSDSVQNKVISQIKYLNEAGANCRGAFFSMDVEKITYLNDEIDLFPVKKCKWKYFQSIGINRCFSKAISEYTKEFNEYNFIYRRYPGADYFFKKFSKTYKDKIIFEHLIIESEEIRIYGKENPFNFTISSFLSRLEYLYIPLLLEKIYGKKTRQNAKLGICNSLEIANWQFNAAKGKYKFIISGDAVEMDKFPLKKPILFKKDLNLVFLKGGTTSASFNGLDRIIKSIENYNGDFNVNLYVVGNNLDYIKNLTLNNRNVFLLPATYGNKLDSLINDMHLGVGSLGFYRKNTHSTTTIKIREYFARGLPFIYAYNDIDIDGNKELKKYSLQLKNDDSIIDLSEVIEFAETIYKNESHSTEMRLLANKYLTFKVKMEKIIIKLSESDV